MKEQKNHLNYTNHNYVVYLLKQDGVNSSSLTSPLTKIDRKKNFFFPPDKILASPRQKKSPCWWGFNPSCLDMLKNTNEYEFKNVNITSKYFSFFSNKPPAR